MRLRIKMAVSIVVITILTLGIIYNYDDIYIEIAKIYMVKTGKVSDSYAKFVMEKKGEMKIHEIAKYGEKKNKIEVSAKLYEKTAEYYINKNATTEVMEIFCSRVDKNNYSNARQIMYREILNRKKKDIKEFLNNQGGAEEGMKKIDALLRYVASTDNPEKNIDIIKDIAPLIIDKKEIYAVYMYLANFYISSNNPYKKDILKMMESDLAGRLTQQEIDRVFRRK